MPPVAGPVFTEWYWEPLFVALFVGLPVLLGAALLETGVSVVAALRGRRRGWGARTATVVALTGAGVAGVLLEIERRADRDAARARAAVLATIDFPVFLPQRPVPGIEPRHSFAVRGEAQLFYDLPGGARLEVLQRPPLPGTPLLAPGCALGEYGRSVFPPSCAPRRTPGGRLLSVGTDEARARLGRVELRMTMRGEVPRATLEAYVDTLRARPAAALYED